MLPTASATRRLTESSGEASRKLSALTGQPVEAWAPPERGSPGPGVPSRQQCFKPEAGGANYKLRVRQPEGKKERQPQSRPCQPRCSEASPWGRASLDPKSGLRGKQTQMPPGKSDAWKTCSATHDSRKHGRSGWFEQMCST